MAFLITLPQLGISIYLYVTSLLIFQMGLHIYMYLSCILQRFMQKESFVPLSIHLNHTCK